MIKKETRGFTLVEVLVGVVIAALCLTGIYAASTQCLKQIWAARDASRAELAADYEIERLQTMPWSNVVSHTLSASNNPALALLNAGSGTVSLVSIGGNSNVLQATVTLTWTGRGGIRNTNAAAAVIISKNDFLR